MKLLLLPTVFALAVSTPTAAHAQTPAEAPAPASTAVPPSNVPSPPADYAYTPDGRRDPFVSLINRGATGPKGAPAGLRAEGIGGILVEEIAVRGIYQSRGTWVAMIAAPSGRTYSIRPGDRLMDGSVRTINAQTVVLMQEVNDPLSLEKQREVRKNLRGEVK